MCVRIIRFPSLVHIAANEHTWTKCLSHVVVLYCQTFRIHFVERFNGFAYVAFGFEVHWKWMYPTFIFKSKCGGAPDIHKSIFGRRCWNPDRKVACVVCTAKLLLNHDGQTIGSVCVQHTPNKIIKLNEKAWVPCQNCQPV